MSTDAAISLRERELFDWTEECEEPEQTDQPSSVSSSAWSIVVALKLHCFPRRVAFLLVYKWVYLTSDTNFNDPAQAHHLQMQRES